MRACVVAWNNKQKLLTWKQDLKSKETISGNSDHLLHERSNKVEYKNRKKGNFSHRNRTTQESLLLLLLLLL